MSHPLDIPDDYFDNVRRDLHRRYGHELDDAVIDRTLDAVIAESLAVARIATFLPITVDREASTRLAEAARAHGGSSDARQEILYVCEHNAGRSQLAASLTHHLVGDRVVVRSVGTAVIGDTAPPPIPPVIPEVLAARGLPTDVLYQKQLVPRTVHRADVVVLMGVEEIPGVPAVRYVHWDIPDPLGKSAAEVHAICDDLEPRIAALLRDMGLEPSAQ